MLSFRSASMTSHCLHDDCLFLLACIYKSTEYLGQQRAQVNNSLRSAAVENCERTFATSCFPVETRERMRSDSNSGRSSRPVAMPVNAWLSANLFPILNFQPSDLNNRNLAVSPTEYLRNSANPQSLRRLTIVLLGLHQS
jgi:hypothetical protein